MVMVVARQIALAIKQKDALKPAIAFSQEEGRLQVHLVLVIALELTSVLCFANLCSEKVSSLHLVGLGPINLNPKILWE